MANEYSWEMRIKGKDKNSILELIGVLDGCNGIASTRPIIPDIDVKDYGELSEDAKGDFCDLIEGETSWVPIRDALLWSAVGDKYNDQIVTNIQQETKRLGLLVEYYGCFDDYMVHGIIDNGEVIIDEDKDWEVVYDCDGYRNVTELNNDIQGAHKFTKKEFDEAREKNIWLQYGGFTGPFYEYFDGHRADGQPIKTDLEV